MGQLPKAGSSPRAPAPTFAALGRPGGAQRMGASQIWPRASANNGWGARKEIYVPPTCLGFNPLSVGGLAAHHKLGQQDNQV